jgi:hypothetical protein
MRDERDELCPYGPDGRAARCQGCVQSSGGLPACIVAWLEPSGDMDVWLTGPREPRLSPQRLRKAA